MIPTAKAKELIDKCLPLAHDWEADCKVIAVKIALLCVDEILKTCPQKENEIFGISKGIEYWQQVKEELKNLEL